MKKTFFTVVLLLVYLMWLGPGMASANTDMDLDGIPDAADNCTGMPNADQADMDTDGMGDACDADRDGDAIPDEADNCTGMPNMDQADMDTDGMGDACDADRDGDTIPDEADNCTGMPNMDQADMDTDGMGDACDADRDGDAIPDVPDNCTGMPDAAGVCDLPDIPCDCAGFVLDRDGDGICNVCDLDGDGDGLPDVVDPAPDKVPNGDVDGDGDTDIGDVLVAIRMMNGVITVENMEQFHSIDVSPYLANGNVPDHVLNMGDIQVMFRKMMNGR